MSKSTLLVFCFFLFSLPPLCCSSSPSEEVNALLQLKKEFDDPFNYLDSWKVTDSPCSFYGVSCDNQTGQVIQISLDYNSLTGKISPAVSALDSLQSLIIPSNFISGELPASIVNCTHLRVLNASSNNITGPLPDLSKLINLEVLDISDNYFAGKFPAWVGSNLSCTNRIIRSHRRPWLALPRKAIM
ncbi:leucine-rich receptor-like protein kinase family protein [Artemisia annua]|uniref:Leucine-rich receptor-like protein kinase family protein n=1 Tax=Artemisia annua TaxID=35608 RepID=A0A2U1L9E3_ARTAN|nr:leucine-rich receptor-like protein kinase family protein [Artemisia annua]